MCPMGKVFFVELCVKKTVFLFHIDCPAHKVRYPINCSLNMTGYNWLGLFIVRAFHFTNDSDIG